MIGEHTLPLMMIYHVAFSLTAIYHTIRLLLWLDKQLPSFNVPTCKMSITLTYSSELIYDAGEDGVLNRDYLPDEKVRRRA